MGKTTRQETGEWGERLAERHLRRKAGMRLLARRWRKGHGELDLIMVDGEVMVFVEVRVRTGEADRLAPYHSIGKGKWRVLRSTALAYVRQSRWKPAAVRFDVVGIRRRKDGTVDDLTHWAGVGAFGSRYWLP